MGASSRESSLVPRGRGPSPPPPETRSDTAFRAATFALDDVALSATEHSARNCARQDLESEAGAVVLCLPGGRGRGFPRGQGSRLPLHFLWAVPSRLCRRASGSQRTGLSRRLTRSVFWRRSECADTLELARSPAAVRASRGRRSGPRLARQATAPLRTANWARRRPRPPPMLIGRGNAILEARFVAARRCAVSRQEVRSRGRRHPPASLVQSPRLADDLSCVARRPTRRRAPKRLRAPCLGAGY